MNVYMMIKYPWFEALDKLRNENECLHDDKLSLIIGVKKNYKEWEDKCLLDDKISLIWGVAIRNDKMKVNLMTMYKLSLIPLWAELHSTELSLNPS
jgi:hypothetical protein